MKKEAVIITNNQGRDRRADTRISKRADANKLIAAVIFNGQVACWLYNGMLYYYYIDAHIFQHWLFLFLITKALC
jgi:hypothetical protein